MSLAEILRDDCCCSFLWFMYVCIYVYVCECICGGVWGRSVVLLVVWCGVRSSFWFVVVVGVVVDVC